MGDNCHTCASEAKNRVSVILAAMKTDLDAHVIPHHTTKSYDFHLGEHIMQIIDLIGKASINVWPAPIFEENQKRGFHHKICRTLKKKDSCWTKHH